MIESSELPNDEQSKTKNPHRINEQKHFEVLDHIFQKNEKLSYSELQTAIINGFDNSFGETASRAFVFHYTDKNWIKKIRDVHKVFYTYSRAAF
jgi:hypothetical protein